MSGLSGFGISLRQRTAQRHLWLLSSIALVVIAVGVVWWNSRAGRQALTAEPGREERSGGQALAVRIRAAVETVVPQRLEAVGTVQPEWEAALSAKVLGRVQSVRVREGDAVHRGEPLITLEARDLDASVAQADANLRASRVGYENARVAARMEASLSQARVAEAQAQVQQSEAALKAANARLDLVQAGSRRQERAQAALTVAQAKTSLTLAESDLNRMRQLYNEGAVSAQQYEQTKTRYELAKSQVAAAQEAQSLTEEGSRAEEVRAAQEAVRQAQAALLQAQAGRRQAQASALQADVRRQEIQSAQAQIGQSQAGLLLARVTRSQAVIVSPFDGIVTQRIADPGMMASPGVPLIKVQGGALRLEAVVPESALPSIRKGSRIPVQMDALGGRRLTGTVAEIAPRGDPSSHTFVVKITLPRGSGASAGMFGRAQFAAGSEKRLLVPASAVFEREGLRYLYVVESSGTARLRMVTVGASLGENVSVLSGLNSGERVVCADLEQMQDGQKVTGEAR